MALSGPPIEPKEFPHFLPRLSVLLVLGAVVLLVLLVQLGRITLLHGADNAALADQSLFRPGVIAAPRGAIFDRHGVPLASHRVVYDVHFSRAGLSRAEIQQVMDRLEPLFPVTIGEWREVLREQRRLPRRPQTLAEGLTLAEVTPIIERIDALPGVTVAEQFERLYPVRGASLGHVLGYVRDVHPDNFRVHLRRWGEDTASIDWGEMARFRPFANLLEEHGYRLGDEIGAQGLEFTWEREMRGVAGRERILQDVHREVINWTVVEPPQQGHALHLTLDLALQRRGMALLAGRPGAIVAMDPRDGAVRALVSSPGFDSDQPITGRGWAALNTDEAGHPLFNRPIRELYNPGSTLKPIVALGALRDGAIDLETTFTCDSDFTLGDHTFHCDYQWGCDTSSVRRAIRRSCNIFFYNTARAMGRESWQRICAAAGLFHPTGIDLPRESAGHVPGSIVLGELVQMGIGQGPFDATPLQMVTAYARLAVDRAHVTPHLVERTTDADGGEVWRWMLPAAADEPLTPGIAPHLRAAVIEALADVTRHEEGTGYRTEFAPEWRVAGKTGTAQNRGLIDAWFIGFAPWDAPEIVVGCVIEGGGHGGDTAAPVVREMMRGYFAPQEPPLPVLPEEPTTD